MTSTGLVTVAKFGSCAASAAVVGAARGSRASPSPWAASAAITHAAPELLTTTSRRPDGRQPFR